MMHPGSPWAGSQLALAVGLPGGNSKQWPYPGSPWAGSQLALAVGLPGGNSKQWPTMLPKAATQHCAPRQAPFSLGKSVLNTNNI